MTEIEPHAGPPQRIDKWLYFTRLAKSRSVAQTMIASGAVTLNGAQIEQPSRTVRLGDKVGIALERRDVLVIVRGPGVRRASFEEARLLYDDTSATLGEQKCLTPFERAQRRPGR